jgi:DNA polymerase
MPLDPRRQLCLQRMGIELWLPKWEVPVEAAPELPAQEPEEVSMSISPEIVPLPPPEAETTRVVMIDHEPEVIMPDSVLWGSLPSIIESNPACPTAMDQESQWQSLQSQVAACTACTLHATRTQTVFGVGNRRAQWLLIGEAPGEQEDLQGEPFVGRAGQLLTEMIRALGYERQDVYIANVLKCRPPRNRDPAPEEAAACEGFLLRQIALLRPRIILAVGRIAAQNLLKTTTPIGKLRGQVHDYEGIPLVVTYHPSYLLRSPTEKRRAWDDLKLALRTFRQ